MKKFCAGVLFTLVSEGAVAVAIAAYMIRNGGGEDE